MAKFVNTAYIKSESPKIMELLEGLGYRASVNNFYQQGEYIYTIPQSSEYCKVSKDQLELLDSFFNGINCGENEKLFISIAAIRLDSDIYQWFVDEEGWSNVNQGTWSPPGSLEYCLEDKFSMGRRKYHKATVEELREKLRGVV